jgi:hypothetical protein
MVQSQDASRVMKMFILGGIDLVVLLMSAALIVQEPRRWPILLVIGPVLFLVTFIGARRIFFMNPVGGSMALSLVYGCGLLGAIYWTLYEFKWWKCIAIAIALFGFVRSFKRSSRPEVGSPL